MITILLAAAVLTQQGDKKGEEQRPLPPTIKVPPSPALGPREAMKTFRLAPGFRIELVASEPLVERPVAMAFDPDGRLWVVEMRGYMPNVEGRGEDDPVGRVAVLEDADGDGRADRRTTFLDGLVLPRAIALVAGGVLVAEPPSLWFCRDRDGDLKCDEKTELAGDYGRRGNPEHTANALTPALDNWIYSANLGVRFRFADGKLLRGYTFSRGQWGLSQDDVGRLFYNTNPEVLRGDLLPAYAAQTAGRGGKGVNQVLLKDATIWPGRVNTGINRGYRGGILREDGTLARVTASCGPAVYRGDNFPDECRGNVFTCEPAANLVKRVTLAEEGDGLSAANAYGRSEFLVSTDERFRPVNLYTGPDGCLYILDLYHGLLQHRNFVTTFLRRQMVERGLESPHGLGRIYRVVHESRPPGPPPRLSRADSAELVRHLSHPNGWWRDTAQRLLVERKDPAAVPDLRKLAASGDVVARLHALFALEGLGKLDEPALAEAEKHPRLRAAAAALKAGVRLDPVDLAFQSATVNPNLTEAMLAPLAGREVDFLERVMASEEWDQASPARAGLLARLAGRVLREGKPERIAELLDLTAVQSLAARWRQAALLEGLSGARVDLPGRSAGLVRLASSEDDRVRALARAVGAGVTWKGRVEEPAPAPLAPLSDEERARFARGKKQFAVSCAVCHSLSGLGEEGKGPPLADSPWAQGSVERLVRIVLNGLTGPVTVGGKLYTIAEMPAVTNMTSDEIAEALTYVRREWGNRAGAVDGDTVRRIRAAVEDREDPWTEKELLNVP